MCLEGSKLSLYQFQQFSRHHHLNLVEDLPLEEIVVETHPLLATCLQQHPPTDVFLGGAFGQPHALKAELAHALSQPHLQQKVAVSLKSALREQRLPLFLGEEPQQLRHKFLLLLVDFDDLGVSVVLGQDPIDFQSYHRSPEGLESVPHPQQSLCGQCPVEQV